jgi:16S rRNA processing protein RimM
VTERPEHIVVGRFGRPRGVSGDIYIHPTTDNPRRFSKLKAVYAVFKDKREQLKLSRVYFLDNRPVVHVEGYDTREAVKVLTNASIEIDGTLAEPLPEGSYYQFDLIGCRVVGADGTDYGRLEEVLFYPAGDVYRIVSDHFDDILLPAIDRFIVDIDIEHKTVTVNPPEGLLTEKKSSEKGDAEN